MFMVIYGSVKVFPLQMPPPSHRHLNEPPATWLPTAFLWNLIGLNPVNEIFCGSAEVLGGILLFYRRTSLPAPSSPPSCQHVVLYNFCYDVPVKLFAANLLLGCIFLALPDALSLCRFFWSHKAAAPTPCGFPPTAAAPGGSRSSSPRWSFAAAFLVVRPIFMTIRLAPTRSRAPHPSPLVGAWHLDATHPASAPSPPRGPPITDLYVAPSSGAYTRSTDGELWISVVNLDPEQHTVRISCYIISAPTNYTGSSPTPTTSFSTRSHPTHPIPIPKQARQPPHPFPRRPHPNPNPTPNTTRSSGAASLHQRMALPALASGESPDNGTAS